MTINPPYPFTMQLMFGYQLKNLILFGKLDRRKRLKHTKYFSPILEVPTCQFTNDEWMTQHAAFVQVISEPLVSRTKMIYPDGCIC